MWICFYSTYKELKLVSVISHSYYLIRVFIVPIRNWNFWCRISWSDGWRLFYSTYKELKLYSSPSILLYMPCFYSTYRNWNSIFASDSPTTLNCFYSTYKELKPGFWLIRQQFCILVFIVPIRNWNSKCYTSPFIIL